MVPFPTNLSTYCQLREAMETSLVCRGVSERTPCAVGVFWSLSVHPSARELQYKRVYSKAVGDGDSFVKHQTLALFLLVFPS